MATTHQSYIIIDEECDGWIIINIVHSYIATQEEEEDYQEWLKAHPKSHSNSCCTRDRMDDYCDKLEKNEELLHYNDKSNGYDSDY